VFQQRRLRYRNWRADRERGNSSALAEGVAHSWEQALFYTIPSAIAFLGIGDFIVALLYETGKFGPAERAAVHLTLMGFSVGLVAYASSRVIASSYQAVQDYRTLWRSAVVAIAVSTVASLALSLPFRDSDYAVAGVAAGAALGAFVNFGLLYRGVDRHVGRIDATGPRRVAMKSLLSAAVALAVASVGRVASTGMGIRWRAVIVISLFSAAYMGMARQLGLDEADRLLAGLRRRIRS